MGKRQDREEILKALYNIDLINDYSESSVKQLAMMNNWTPATNDTILKIAANINTIDQYISKYLKNWAIGRIAVVDRNILRLAISELLYEPVTPIKVIINEAVEIAKKYGTKDSFSFINAVLDKVARELKR
ncbi:MAG: transcription antitermination factor NusB [Deltaproteobacteria bacterium]|nr:transcription antitermination factor NusB [Deltaproteobacteria bacterium]MCL5792150.1 transcription antitermination factor NusB [Deltaproteobacteria bacterium]